MAAYEMQEPLQGLYLASSLVPALPFFAWRSSNWALPYEKQGQIRSFVTSPVLPALTALERLCSYVPRARFVAALAMPTIDSMPWSVATKL